MGRWAGNGVSLVTSSVIGLKANVGFVIIHIVKPEADAGGLICLAVRSPGVSSISAFRNYVAKLLTFVVTEKNREECKEREYSSWSISHESETCKQKKI